MSIFGLELTLQVVVGLVSASIAAIAALLVWLQWRERRLRQDDVLRWANDVIRAQQTLYLLLFLGESAFSADEARALRARLIVDISVLVEQGRLFFRNTPHPTHGADRHPAYRGYRPLLLDPIVISHQIACRWEAADAAAREKMVIVAEDSVRSFVSMVQREVGRSRTVHRDSALKGEGEKLDVLLERVRPERLEALRQHARLSL